MTNSKRAEEFMKCLGNGSGSEEQAYADDTPVETMMPNGKPDMNDLAHALKEEDYCEAMKLIGYSVLYFDEDNESDIYFISKDELSIVYYNLDEQEFWTYSRANHFVLKDRKVTNGN